APDRDVRKPHRQLDREFAREPGRFARDHHGRAAVRADALLHAQHEARHGTGGTMSGVQGVRGWVMNPWARARFLWVMASAYVVWTLAPVLIAVAFSFNAGKAQTTW